MDFFKSHFTKIMIDDNLFYINDKCHSLCNKNNNIHNGLHLNELGCIHVNPNDEYIDNSSYIWSHKYKQWKRLRYHNNHKFCYLHKDCVYWHDYIYKNCKNGIIKKI